MAVYLAKNIRLWIYTLKWMLPALRVQVRLSAPFFVRFSVLLLDRLFFCLSAHQYQITIQTRGEKYDQV